jgi:hypothetical protein
VNWIEVEARLSRHRAGVRGASWEIRTWARPRWQHTSGYLVPEKNKEGLARVFRVQTLSKHRPYTEAEGGREEGGGRRMGGTGTTAYLSSSTIHHGLPTRRTCTTTGACGSGPCSGLLAICRDGRQKSEVRACCAEELARSRERETSLVCFLARRRSPCTMVPCHVLANAISTRWWCYRPSVAPIGPGAPRGISRW